MEMWKDELYHHGILGQKWGVRRYQNKDGTLTDTGKRHLARSSKKFDKLDRAFSKKSYKLAKRQQKFQKTAKRPTITDTDLELKRRQGAKLSKSYRSYMKTGKRFVKNFESMQKNYGFNNLSQYQINKGREYTDQYLKNKGLI